MKYTDPNGNEIVPHYAYSNMSSHSSLLGNSKSEKVNQAGCYITAMVNIIASRQISSNPRLEYNGQFRDVIDINRLKTLFAAGTGELGGRDASMNALFGKGEWDFWTRDKQGVSGMLAKLTAYQDSGKKFMIMGIFDLSEANKDVPNHMVGINGLPDADGVFNPDSIVPTSNGDRSRLKDDAQKGAYSMKNLKEIRVIFLE